jgi:predicted RNA-binding protein with PUA domain
VIKYFCKNCNINVESSECSVCGERTEVERIQLERRGKTFMQRGYFQMVNKRI